MSQCLTGKQWIQFPPGIQSIKIITATHMLIIDEDLGQRTLSTRPLSHRCPCGFISINTIFRKVNPLFVQQRLCPNAEGAGTPGINFDLRCHSS